MTLEKLKMIYPLYEASSDDGKLILTLIERVEKLSQQLEEAVRVIEATKGDITYKDLDNNETINMLDSAKESFAKTLAYYGSHVELE